MPQEAVPSCVSLQTPYPSGQVFVLVGWFGHERLRRDLNNDQIEPSSSQIGKRVDRPLVEQRAQADNQSLGR
jgi:hypothetical protein